MTSSPTENASGDSVAIEVSIADLAIRLEQAQILLIDVRPSQDVADGHIPGSWPIAVTALSGRLRDVDDPLHRRLGGRKSSVAMVAGDRHRFVAAEAICAEVGVAVVGVAGEVRAWSRAGRPLNRGQHG